MLMKLIGKRAIWLCLMLLVLPYSAWAGNFDKGILWEVSKAGQLNSYIFGTIHSADPRVTKLPAQLKSILKQARSFTVEVDLNTEAMLQLQSQLFLPANQSLKKIVGPQLYQESVLLMSRYGVPEPIVDKMKPWVVAVELSSPKEKKGLILDLKLYQLAQQQGLKLHGLETVAEQINVFDDLPVKQQKLMLSHAINAFPNMPQKYATLIEYYVQRDLRGLLKFNDEEMSGLDSSLKDVLATRLITKRNHLMVKRMQPQLAQGKAIVAIGALHLPGEEGILQLLENRGYQLKAIY